MEHARSTRLPSAEECIAEFDIDADGLLSLSELGNCLDVVLKRSGCGDACSKELSGQILEEYSLRADGAPAGAGALFRLLQAASDRASARSRSPIRERSHENPGTESKASFNASAKEALLQAEAVSWAAPSTLAAIPVASDDEIPTLDFAIWQKEPQRAVKLLRDACQKVGFFFLVDHGVTDAVLEAGVRLVEDWIWGKSFQVRYSYVFEFSFG